MLQSKGFRVSDNTGARSAVDSGYEGELTDGLGMDLTMIGLWLRTLRRGGWRLEDLAGVTGLKAYLQLRVGSASLL